MERCECQECGAHPTVQEGGAHPTVHGCGAHPTVEGCGAHPTVEGCGAYQTGQGCVADPTVEGCKCGAHLRPHQHLIEDQVAEEIREKWEREQTEYKQRVVQVDTADIQSLVLGSQLKEDGREFYIGGVDISFIKGNNVDACSCLTVVRMSDLETVYQRIEMIELTQPYIPGYLAFREVPSLVDLYNKMKRSAPHYLPDVIMVDGNGILHPRSFGTACHLGVLLNVPTVGVAKTLITAQGIQEGEEHKLKKQKLKAAGDFFDLVSDTGTILGRCVRTGDKAVNPIYISVGQNITLDSAMWICLRCSKYRIPEPLRKADIDSREYLRVGKTQPYEFIRE